MRGRLAKAVAGRAAGLLLFGSPEIHDYAAMEFVAVSLVDRT